jgi:GNAT superfamily N-acetyltransferase
MESIIHMPAHHRVAVGDFLARLSPATRQARYLGPVELEGPSRERELRRLQSSDAVLHTVLLAMDGDEVRGIGEYVVESTQADRAEVALVVEDGLQGRGIGTSLFLDLEQHARRHGIKAFTGEVANDNHRVVVMLRNAGRPLQIRPGYASSHFELTLRDDADSLAA